MGTRPLHWPHLCSGILHSAGNEAARSLVTTWGWIQKILSSIDSFWLNTKCGGRNFVELIGFHCSGSLKVGAELQPTQPAGSRKPLKPPAKRRNTVLYYKYCTATVCEISVISWYRCYSHTVHLLLLARTMRRAHVAVWATCRSLVSPLEAKVQRTV